MQAILFVGLQASGKSSFFKQRFFDTHIRIKKLQTYPGDTSKFFLEVRWQKGRP